MESAYDYKKFAILYVDDEEKSLKYFARAFQDHFRILTVANAQDGLKLLEQHPEDIGILMTDQRMPGEKGVWLLEKARNLRPYVIRILATAYADMDAAVAAVNTGAIYKYIMKPWDPPQLETMLKRGLEFFMVQRERDQLLQEKRAALHKVMITDRIVSLGLLAAGLSHHIHSAFAAVKTFLDLAPAPLDKSTLDVPAPRPLDLWKAYSQNIYGEIDKIDHMLKELCVASEKTSVEFNEWIKLHEVIGGTAEKLKDSFVAKNIHVAQNVPHDLPQLMVDRLKFNRLFELLFTGAVISLPPGSHIVVSAKAIPEGAFDTAHLEVRVHDDGPGLSREALRLISDPFVPPSDGGAQGSRFDALSGLTIGERWEYNINLMACYFMVYHHGGKIEAQSESGQGTTFTLRFPTSPGPPKILEENG